jgi:hypothetical protein
LNCALNCKAAKRDFGAFAAHAARLAELLRRSSIDKN